MYQGTNLRSTISKDYTFLDQGGVSALRSAHVGYSLLVQEDTHNGKLDGHGVCFLSKCLREGVIQSSDILEPGLALRVTQEEIFGAICSILPVRHDLGWPAIFDDHLERIRALRNKLEVV